MKIPGLFSGEASYTKRGLTTTANRFDDLARRLERASDLWEMLNQPPFCVKRLQDAAHSLENAVEALRDARDTFKSRGLSVNRVPLKYFLDP